MLPINTRLLLEPCATFLFMHLFAIWTDIDNIYAVFLFRNVNGIIFITRLIPLFLSFLDGKNID